MKRLKRLCRMAPMLLKGEITLSSFNQSMNLQQKSVCMVGGGMVFCDRCTENRFFK